MALAEPFSLPLEKSGPTIRMSSYQESHNRFQYNNLRQRGFGSLLANIYFSFMGKRLNCMILITKFNFQDLSNLDDFIVFLCWLM